MSEHPEEQVNNDINGINVGKMERWLSAVGGGGLIAYGLKRRTWPGLALALVGGVLVHRGVTGHCYAYQAIGANTAEKRQLTEKEREERDSKKRNRPVVQSKWRRALPLISRRKCFIRYGRTCKTSLDFSIRLSRSARRTTAVPTGWPDPAPAPNWNGKRI